MRNKTLVLTLSVHVLIVLLLSFSARGEDFYESAVITSDMFFEEMNVYDTQPQTTVIDFYGIANALNTNDSSVFNIYDGGHLDGWATENHYAFTANGTSTINLYQGGLIDGGSWNSLRLFNNSKLNVEGGVVHTFFGACDSSIVNVNGNLNYGFSLTENSIMNLYGGYIGVFLENNTIEQTSMLNIYGYGFNYNPQDTWEYMEDPANGWWVSKLTGFSLDGTPFSYRGIPDPATHPNIIFIPEPATLLMFGLGGLFLRRKR